MSDNLSRMAHKIDFLSDEEQDPKDASKSDEKQEKTDEKSKLQPSLWPWDSVRNKLK